MQNISYFLLTFALDFYFIHISPQPLCKRERKSKKCATGAASNSGVLNRVSLYALVKSFWIIKSYLFSMANYRVTKCGQLANENDFWMIKCKCMKLE
jgi:hypothetical protein